MIYSQSYFIACWMFDSDDTNKIGMSLLIIYYGQ